MSRRRAVWAVTVVMLAVALGLGGSTVLGLTLQPTHNPLPASNFQGGDGNQADDHGFIDWQRLVQTGVVAQGRGHTSDRPTGQDDHFSQGSKENDPGGWTLVVGNLGSPGADLLDIYRAFERGTNGDGFLYLAMTRAATTGTWFLTYEINQAAPRRNTAPLPGHPNGLAVPCRETGDLLITFEEKGNETAVHVEEWITDPGAVDSHGCARTGHLEDVTNISNANVQGAFNAPTTGAIHNYLPGHLPVGGAIPAGHFVEAAINLTKVLNLEDEPCANRNFLSTWAHSRSSLSATADMKDYVAPEPFVISVCKASPELTTTQGADIGGGATPARTAPIGTPIFDTAHLSGGNAPTGTITFRLYRPGDRRCTRPPVFTTSRHDVNGNGSYNSAPFTPTRVGTYRWRAEYSGDANNHPVGPTGCRAEPVRITRARPALRTEASGTAVLPGGTIHDTATLTGGHSPTGTITFKLFSPSDTTCASPAHTFPPVTVNGNGSYRSPTPDFTPTAAGTWRWIAAYSGDARNAPESTLCNDLGESVAVTETPPPARPGLTTAATPSAPAGTAITDTAHLTGGMSPTGTITFYVFGPNNSGCAGAPATPPSAVEVTGAGDYTSAPFTPTEAGTYHWVAHYSGDANNEPAATSCNESGENSVVAAAHPSIATSAAPATAPYGHPIGDVAVLRDGADPRGTITFRLYGPNDDSCSAAPAFIVDQEVIGNGSYPSPTIKPTLSGVYRWVAKYSGDARNASASTRCGDPGETVVVEPAPPIHPPVERPEPKPRPKPKPKPKPPAFTG